MEVTIGSEASGSKASGSAGSQGPAISAPAESKAVIPPAPTSVAEAEQAVTQAEQATTASNGLLFASFVTTLPLCGKFDPPCGSST